MAPTRYLRNMQTTLTLDDEIAGRLRQRCRETGKSLEAIANEVLRLGLNSDTTLRSQEPFRVDARSMGLRPGIQLDNIGELLEQLDGPAHK